MNQKILRSTPAFLLLFVLTILLGLTSFNTADAWTLLGENSVEWYLGVGIEDPNYDFHIHNRNRGVWMQFTSKTTGTDYSDGLAIGVEGDNTAQFWTESGMPIIMVPGGSLYSTDRTYFNSNGRVGIGIANPTSKLAVNGMIETRSGGIKFPDGTVQTTAQGSGPGPAIYAGGSRSSQRRRRLHGPCGCNERYCHVVRHSIRNESLYA